MWSDSDGLIRWVEYRIADGAELVRGSSSDPDAMRKQKPMSEENALMQVPIDAIRGPQIALPVVIRHVRTLIDEEASTVRARFITSGTGQDITYMYKALEASAWASGNDPASAPFLAKEAAATGVSIDDLAAAVRANAQAWTAIGSEIEALRIGAKQAVGLAINLAEIAAAAVVDWSALPAS